MNRQNLESPPAVTLPGKMSDAERDAVLQLWAQQQGEAEGALTMTSVTDVAEALHIPADHVQRLLVQVRVEEQAAARATELREASRRHRRARRIASYLATTLLVIAFVAIICARDPRWASASPIASSTQPDFRSGTATTGTGAMASTTATTGGGEIFTRDLPTGYNLRLGEHWAYGQRVLPSSTNFVPTARSVRSQLEFLVSRVEAEVLPTSTPSPDGPLSRRGSLMIDQLSEQFIHAEGKDSIYLSWEDLSLECPQGKVAAKLPFARTQDVLLQDAVRKERRRRIEQAIDQFRELRK